MFVAGNPEAAVYRFQQRGERHDCVAVCRQAAGHGAHGTGENSHQASFMIHLMFQPQYQKVTSLPHQHLQISEVSVQRLDAPGHMTALLSNLSPTPPSHPPPNGLFAKPPLPSTVARVEVS
ncbi:hypothetical protein FQN60_001629 [Etheostoma spectabile]|uniref:Uncharacterized protein n=1 Tax=Etheostoma spectabile TaxID=54343 RepID=A0A5J5D770_9PERO|nr:hypothetical protein FQN60_001629 [Etheostoma spectabile]